MAETMEQYMSKTRADYGSGVARPKIEDKDNFELKGQFLKELRTNTFSSLDHEDANGHIEKVLEIVDLFHLPNITIDQVMLRAFLMSLTSPTSRTAKKRRKSTTHKNQMKKPLPHGAIKKLLMKCPSTLFNERCRGGGYKTAAPGFYQRNNANPSYQERRQSMEDTLSKFMSESAKRHEENSNLIKDIRASTDASIRNQGVSIKTLEIQIGQMSKLLQEKGFGSLPSPPSNLIDQVKSLDPFFEDYIKLNDLNEPFELTRNQGDDLMPTIEKDEADRDDGGVLTEMVVVGRWRWQPAVGGGDLWKDGDSRVVGMTRVLMVWRRWWCEG
ncbi:hypothetical protein Tco_0558277 [Tanacetum coccineum]